MPVITIDGPKLSKDQKQELVKLISEDASKVTGLPVEAMVVLIRESDPENVVSGCLLCDIHPEVTTVNFNLIFLFPFFSIFFNEFE